MSSSLVKEFQRVKKARVDPTHELIDKLIERLTSAQRDIDALSVAQHEDGGSLFVGAQVAAAASEVQQMDVGSLLAAHHREVQAVHAKFCKSIDKALPMDVEPVLALLNGGLNDEPSPALLRAIVLHLCSQGQLEAANTLLAEAMAAPATKASLEAGELGEQLRAYERLHAMQRAMAAHDLAPAIAWIEEFDHHHAERGAGAGGLALAGDGGGASGEAERHDDDSDRPSEELVFVLHRLRFVQLLVSAGESPSALTSALEYARNRLVPSDAANARMAEVQQLMGALLFAGRLEDSPYAHLLGEHQWQIVSEQLRRELLRLHRLPGQSSLLTCVQAGTIALPALHKMALVLQRKAGARSLGSCEVLPAELSLPKDLSFHSIITCPVSREQCTRENPPLLLPCGHVLSLASVTRLSRACRVARFKCPYCPSEATANLCRQVRAD